VGQQIDIGADAYPRAVGGGQTSAGSRTSRNGRALIAWVTIHLGRCSALTRIAARRQSCFNGKKRIRVIFGSSRPRRDLNEWRRSPIMEAAPREEAASVPDRWSVFRESNPGDQGSAVSACPARGGFDRRHCSG